MKNAQVGLKIVIVALIGLISLNVMSAVASQMNARIWNFTQHEIKTSVGWQLVYGSRANNIDNSPISKNSDLTVVSLDLREPTKYQASYDVWTAAGEYLGNCTLAFAGPKDGFRADAYAEYSCSTGDIYIDVKKQPALLGDEGQFTFDFHANY